MNPKTMMLEDEAKLAIDGDREVWIDSFERSRTIYMVWLYECCATGRTLRMQHRRFWFGLLRGFPNSIFAAS